MKLVKSKRKPENRKPGKLPSAKLDTTIKQVLPKDRDKAKRRLLARRRKEPRSTIPMKADAGLPKTTGTFVELLEQLRKLKTVSISELQRRGQATVLPKKYRQNLCIAARRLDISYISRAVGDDNMLVIALED